MTPFVDGPGQTYERDGTSVEIGLYSTGNDMPDGRQAEGEAIAEQIASAERFAMVSIGMSNTTQEFAFEGGFLDFAAQYADDLNPNLVLVDAARGGQDARAWSGDMQGTCDTTVDDTVEPYRYLAQSLVMNDLAPEDVRVAWVKIAMMGPGMPDNGGGGFPEHVEVLQAHIECALARLAAYLPNLQLVFLTSRSHACVNTGTPDANELNPEPYAYESGFAMRWMIDAQIEGTGNVGMPFLAWGPYLWANGADARTYDGFQWSCPEDVGIGFKGDTQIRDCTHPSGPDDEHIGDMSGREKVGCLLWNFFAHDAMTTPWFLDADAGEAPWGECSVEVPDPDTGGDESGDSGGSDGSGDDGAEDDGGETSGTSGGTTAPPPGGDGGDGGGTGGGEDGGAEDPAETGAAGCGCRGGGPSPVALWLLLGLSPLWRRRRAASSS